MRRDDSKRIKVKIVHDSKSRPRILVIPWDSNFRKTWDLIAVSLVLFSTFQVPFSLSFTNFEISTTLIQFIEFFFYIDIGLNFITAYVYQGEHITNRKRIAFHYLKTWLFVDLIASIP